MYKHLQADAVHHAYTHALTQPLSIHSQSLLIQSAIIYVPLGLFSPGGYLFTVYSFRFLVYPICPPFLLASIILALWFGAGRSVAMLGAWAPRETNDAHPQPPAPPPPLPTSYDSCYATTKPVPLFSSHAFFLALLLHKAVSLSQIRWHSPSTASFMLSFVFASISLCVFGLLWRWRL